MKILHIGPDSQFIQFLSGIFEAVAPGANRYLITSAPAKEKLQFPPHSDFVEILPRGIKGMMRMPMHVRSTDLIIAHGMSPYGITAFLTSTRKTVRVWSGWGFDYYGPDVELISPATKALMLTDHLTYNPTSIVTRLTDLLNRYGHEYAAKRTSYFSAPIPSDLDVFKRRFENFIGEYAQLNYGSVNDTFAQSNVSCNGINILVGNSAAVTNNHVDVFHMLAKQDLGSRKVFVPLSYGDQFYRINILHQGKEILGDAFVPLINFLSFEEYRAIVASCNVVVMNHFRQQALGNIGAALHQGAHVYLNNLSPVYDFFKAKGAAVRVIGDLELNSLPSMNLPLDDVTKNRAILEQFWGNNQIRGNVERLLALVRSRLDNGIM